MTFLKFLFSICSPILHHSFSLSVPFFLLKELEFGTHMAVYDENILKNPFYLALEKHRPDLSSRVAERHGIVSSHFLIYHHFMCFIGNAVQVLTHLNRFETAKVNVVCVLTTGTMDGFICRTELVMYSFM